MKNDEGNYNIHPYYPFLKWGFLHTPFMIFVRSHNTLVDEDFMKLLGLRDYQKRHPPLPSLRRYVVFANDTEWTHIADDFGYTLWHNPRTAEVVEELSRNFDVFRCSIGDIDNSFEFRYYKNGDLIREFVFDDDPFKHIQSVNSNKGRRLLGEPTGLNDLLASAEKMFPTITQALGIVRVNDPLRNRYYCKLQEG